VRELEADEQIGIRVRAEARPMRGDELVAQRGDRGQGPGRDHQLIRVRAAVRAHGDGLAAPDQLRAAFTEVAPAARGEVARLPVGRSVPSFHRQDTEPVADANAVGVERLGQGRCLGRAQIRIEWQRRADAREMGAERVRRLQGGNTGIGSVTHDGSRLPCSITDDGRETASATIRS
jgi:hypothetical protein